jgi:SAM-dependent methyltransferase
MDDQRLPAGLIFQVEPPRAIGITPADLPGDVEGVRALGQIREIQAGEGYAVRTRRMPALKAVKTSVTRRRSRFSSPAMPSAAARANASRPSGNKRPAAIRSWRTLRGVSQLDRVRRIYDRNPAGYHRGSVLTERLLAARRMKVGEIVRGRLLDIGFGTGLSLPHYPPSVDVVGIDASLGMLHFARSEAASLDRLVRVAEMDAEHLAFGDQTFDSIAFNLCLCTIADPERAVKEALRVARPGAPMVFLEHVRSHLLPIALLQEAASPLLFALEQDHFNRRTEETIRRAGVEVISVERFALGSFNLIVGRSPAAT